MSHYPNKDTLYKAYDIYRDAMREFISSTTSEELISDTLGREPVDDIRALIDIGNIPHLLRRLWDDVFDELFDYPDAMDIRSAAGVIRDGRNRSWGHPGVGDFDIDFTRVYLFLIADVLKEIDKLDAKREVEKIRDQLFSHKIEEQPVETGQVAAYKERFTTMSSQLAATVAGKAAAEERLSDILNRLEAAKVEKAELEKRLKTMADQLEEAKAEKTKYGKAFKAVSNQLATLKSVNAQLEARLETTSTQLEDVEAELTACKKDLARTLRQLEETEAGQTEYLSPKERLARALTESEKEETEEERAEIAKRVAELRLNPDASKKMSWKNIRKEVLLTNDEFHENIRISDYYKEIMLERLGNLIDEGWVYNGSLNILCGFDVPEEFVERMESNKAKAKVAEAPSYRGDTAKSPKYQRKWRRPGAVAALRDPAEIREAEAKIANILNPSEKTRLELELREAKRAVYDSEI